MKGDFMNSEDIEFCKNIISDSNFKQFLILENCKKKLTEHNCTKQEINKINLENFNNTLNILKFINNEKKLLNQKQKQLLYNNFIYKIRLLFNITRKDLDLENAILIQSEINKLEKISLMNMEKLLNNLIYTNDYIKLPNIFLYLSSLITVIIDIDNYYNRCLTQNDCNSNYFNVNFNSEININGKKEDIYKLKTLILNLGKNSQE